MDLVIGHSYYWLDATQHDFVHNYVVGPGETCPFQLGPGGYYYVEYGAMTSDLLNALYEAEEDNSMELVQVMDYTFSNQLPTGSGF